MSAHITNIITYNYVGVRVCVYLSTAIKMHTINKTIVIMVYVWDDIQV